MLTFCSLVPLAYCRLAAFAGVRTVGMCTEQHVCTCFCSSSKWPTGDPRAVPSFLEAALVTGSESRGWDSSEAWNAFLPVSFVLLPHPINISSLAYVFFRAPTLWDMPHTCLFIVCVSSPQHELTRTKNGVSDVSLHLEQSLHMVGTQWESVN